MMQRRPGMPSRPAFPAELLGLTDDEYSDFLRAANYSENMIEQELDLFQRFRQMYRPEIRKSVNSVPVNDTADQAYQALLRSQEKHAKEDAS